jgi:hypothetical protein
VKGAIVLTVVILTLGCLTVLQAKQLRARPVLIKLGPPPDSQSLSLFAGEQKPLLAWQWVTRVMFYYGSLFEPDARKIKVLPEYYNMYKTIEAAIRLDPYNMDAYYFSQAAFTWEIGRAKEVNALLLYGMKFRDWDYQLPFYAGFNASYFLHDYAEGARLMRLAAERSGSPLLTNLAARYFYQARQTDLGMAFLEMIIDQTRDLKLRKVYTTRLTALHAVKEIESAAELYHKQNGSLPRTIDVLVSSGFLKQIPADPYGGNFYLEKDGSVVSTSQFAFKSGQEPENQ